MLVHQERWTKSEGWLRRDGKRLSAPQLTIVFGARPVLDDPATFEDIRSRFTGALVLCSTAGEILGSEVSDGTLSVTQIQFEKSRVEVVIDDAKMPDSFASGARIAESLPKEGLVHAMIFADGLNVNGTELVRGIVSVLGSLGVSVTGGLVGDGSDFKKTLVGYGAAPLPGKAVLVGFYGKDLRVGYGSFGGWDTFGVQRTITKSNANVLYELDGKPALLLYKEYLGEKAKELPSSGLLFPLSLEIMTKDGARNVVRTLLAVDEKAQSLTFAGDMPQGTRVTLMKANFEKLIDGAGGAAGMSLMGLGGKRPELAILVSCIGRKLVLKERVEEEVEAVSDAVGNEAAIAGFYSYGEICPTAPTEKQCQLHNQTMTITTFLEL